MRETRRPWQSHRVCQTCRAEPWWKSSACVARPFLWKPAARSVRAYRWSLGSLHSRECGDLLGPLSMSARTNAPRLLSRCKHYLLAGLLLPTIDEFRMIEAPSCNSGNWKMFRTFLLTNAAWIIDQLQRVERLRGIRRPKQHTAGRILFRGESIAPNSGFVPMAIAYLWT